MTSDLMLAIKTIIIVSPNWRKVLKMFRQTEVRFAIGASGDRQRTSYIWKKGTFVIETKHDNTMLLFYHRFESIVVM